MTRTVVCAAALLLALSMAPSVQADLPNCSDINCPNKPCDKRCLNDSGDQITCEEYGQGCQGGPPPGGCQPPPIISATPNPADKNAPVSLSVTNPSSDLLPYAFVWSFGDGNHSQGSLSETHTYAAAGSYTVYWEGWARCTNGTDKFMSNTLTLAIVNPGNGGPGPGGECPPSRPGCVDDPEASEREKPKER